MPMKNAVLLREAATPRPQRRPSEAFILAADAADFGSPAMRRTLGMRTAHTWHVGTQAGNDTTRGGHMLYWAAVFFIIALVAAFFGFFGLAATSAGIAKILFLVFLVLAVVSVLLGRRAPMG
jgi:uncharacterized membrane protein YtjA (UPF0391 family)